MSKHLRPPIKPIWHIFSASLHIFFRSPRHVLPSSPNFTTRTSHDHEVRNVLAQLAARSSTTPHDIYFHHQKKFKLKTLSPLSYWSALPSRRPLYEERTCLKIAQVLFFFQKLRERGQKGDDRRVVGDKTRGAFLAFPSISQEGKGSNIKVIVICGFSPRSVLFCHIWY